MPAPHLGVTLAVAGRTAEVAPSLDHLLGRAAADAELQAATADQSADPVSSAM